MAQNVLKMKYHPAKKAVEFRALQDGVEFSNYTTSTLHHNYENDTFVLQHQGNDFFEAVRELYNGTGRVRLEVTTTKTDYEDLEQMVEYYNRELEHKKSSFKIIANLEATLPDMDHVYKSVRDYGEKAVAILDAHREDFHTIRSDNETVQESIALFSKSVQEEINNIRDKLKRMDDNTVNLCFTGIYSAGKSTLINAILGCRILPENIKPTTARSFRIRSPKAGEGIRIEFFAENAPMTLAWDEKTGALGFTKSLADNSSAKTINALLEECRAEPKYEQIYRVLNQLNSDGNVGAVIDVIFPVPLDTKNVHFMILDTPGTDSNNIRHGQVLRNALREQESSILIFVVPANHATDGKGNKDLLNLLESEGRAIDLDRSLFVINYADCVDSKAREALKTGKIKAKDEQAEDDFQIDLTAKKLFFTSAKAAYVARAIQSNIATKEETKKFNSFHSDAVDEEFGCYYQDNHCATSDYATNRMIERCQDALKKAEGDQYQEVVVCSGLFALEDEIVRYGEKYASAVRAHAIIDSVDQALVKMSGKADSLASDTSESISEIAAKISRIRDSLTKAIDAQAEKFSLTDEKGLSDDILRKLNIGGDYFGLNVIIPSIESVKKQLGIFPKVKFSEKQRDQIAEGIATALAEFEAGYVNNRQKELERIQKQFIHNVRQAIQDNGEIDPKVGDFICEINPPTLKPVEVRKIRDIYERLKQNERFIIFRREYVNKAMFLDELSGFFGETQVATIEEYKKEFGEAINAMVETTKKAYMENLDKYSLLLQAMRSDKISMEELMRKIKETAVDLKRSRDELNKIIWEGTNDAA